MYENVGADETLVLPIENMMILETSLSYYYYTDNV